MEDVSIWIGVVLGVIGILAAFAGMLRWFAHWIVETVDVRIDQRLDERLVPINEQLVAIHHHGEMVDLRLGHLEADMVLVKQHLLGSTAA